MTAQNIRSPDYELRHFHYTNWRLKIYIWRLYFSSWSPKGDLRIFLISSPDLSIFECKNQIDTSFFRDDKLRYKHCRSLLLIQKTHKNWRQFIQNTKIDSIVLVLPHTDVKLSHGIVVVCCWSTTFTQTHKNSEKKLAFLKFVNLMLFYWIGKLHIFWMSCID